MKNEIKKEKCFWACVLCGCFFLYLMWAVIIPYDHAPDEYMRYDIPEYIFKYGRLPHGGAEEIRNPIWGFSYGFTPITSYIIGAFFMWITSIFNASDFALLIAARLVSVLFSVGTVFLCIKISNRIFKSVFKYAFVISVAILPQFVFISSYVNNDAFGLFTVAWIIYAMIYANDNKWNLKSCIFLGVGIGLCLISYYNCYGIIIAAFIFAILSVIYDESIEHKFKFAMTRIIWILITVLLVSGWWFIRNAILYDGDFLGLSTSRKYGEKYAWDMYKPSNRVTPYNSGLSMKEMLIDKKWIELTAKSFIGYFDYMSLPVKDWCYNIMYVVAAACIVGNLIPGRLCGIAKDKTFSFVKLAMVIMCIITIGLSVGYSYFSDFEPQGRYLLPMLISFNLLIINGWERIFNRCNHKIKGLGAAIIIGIYCVVCIYSTSYILIPRYIYM